MTRIINLIVTEPLTVKYSDQTLVEMLTLEDDGRLTIDGNDVGAYQATTV